MFLYFFDSLSHTCQQKPYPNCEVVEEEEKFSVHVYRDLPKFRTLDALEVWEVFIAMYFPTLKLVIAGDSNTQNQI